MATAGAAGMVEGIVVACEDRYEAQKLASLIFVSSPYGEKREGWENGGEGGKEDEGQTCIRAVVNAIGNEVIISLMDGSSHSVLFRDETAVDAFVDFVQSLTDGIHRLVMVKVLDDKKVRIVKDLA